MNLEIPLVVVVILRKSNLESIGEYVALLHNLGVYHIRFGTSLKVGRNDTKTESDWDISQEECTLFSEKLKILRTQYPDIIIDKFDEEVSPFDPNKNQYRFQCDAGTSYITISEQGKVRPCVYMPPQYFEVQSIGEYFHLIEKGHNFDYGACIDSCLKDLRTEHRHLDDICPHGFS